MCSCRVRGKLSCQGAGCFDNGELPQLQHLWRRQQPRQIRAINMNYYEIHSLANIYLEDSYVLAIVELADSLTFELEAVLTEKHAKYEKPRDGEHYCYRRVSLRFLNVDYFEWCVRRFVVSSGSDGELDYGNIDTFNGDDGWYALSGDWGEVLLRGRNIEVSVVEE